ncbi:MAG TPA: CpsD/CapB family tyrosine-protein kinase [Clostridia bacterium]|nr:CpsD/CapB family tyrosine-protein kinase [Clostridia bacterium]
MTKRAKLDRDTIPIVLLPDAPFEVKEAYKALRTNLQFLSVDSKLKSILVTSTQPMESKTTVVVNLSIALAQAGLKVLIVDADTRNPSIHKYLRLPSIPGLTNYLVGKYNIADIILKTKFGVDVVPSGSLPPNPSELLGSARMGELVRILEANYDYVLYDTPPSLLITDAAVLSKYMDGVVFTVRYKTTEVEAARFVKGSLENVGARIICCIITDIETSGFKGSGYYSYKQYYNKYYKKEIKDY